MRLPFFHGRRDDETKLDRMLQEDLPSEDTLSQQGFESEGTVSALNTPSPMPSPPATTGLSADMIREFDRLNAKLDYLKSMLDQLLERVKRLEEKRW